MSCVKDMESYSLISTFLRNIVINIIIAILCIPLNYNHTHTSYTDTASMFIKLGISCTVVAVEMLDAKKIQKMSKHSATLFDSYFFKSV